MDAYANESNSGHPSGELLTIAQAADVLGVSVVTLRRWDRSGALKALRTPTNRMRYRREDVLSALRAA